MISKIIVCDYKVCDPSVVSNILICNTMYCMMEGQEILDHVTMPCLMHHIVRFGHVTSHNIGIQNSHNTQLLCFRCWQELKHPENQIILTVSKFNSCDKQDRTELCQAQVSLGMLLTYQLFIVLHRVFKNCIFYPVNFLQLIQPHSTIIASELRISSFFRSASSSRNRSCKKKIYMASFKVL